MVVIESEGRHYIAQPWLANILAHPYIHSAWMSSGQQDMIEVVLPWARYAIGVRGFAMAVVSFSDIPELVEILNN